MIKEANWYDGMGVTVNGGPDSGDTQAEGSEADTYKYWGRLYGIDGPGGGNEGKWRGHYSTVGVDAQGL